MRSVVITWTEVSTHSVVVNVPADFDPEATRSVGWPGAAWGVEDPAVPTPTRRACRCPSAVLSDSGCATPLPAIDPATVYCNQWFPNQRS